MWYWHMRLRSSSVKVFLGWDAIGGTGGLTAFSGGIAADAGGIATGGEALKPPGLVSMLGQVGCDGTINIGSAG